jgi:hypothetical protein
MMRSAGIEDEFIPCLSVVLRFAIHRQTMSLQLLPELVACLWAIAFFWKHRDRWDWMQDGALLMLVSIFASPYAWITDQAVLIPALMVGVYRATSRAQLCLLAMASATIELAQLLGAIELAYQFCPEIAWFRVPAAAMPEPPLCAISLDHAILARVAPLRLGKLLQPSKRLLSIIIPECPPNSLPASRSKPCARTFATTSTSTMCSTLPN